ncbi:MAG: protein kinase [Nocardioides sp.]
MLDGRSNGSVASDIYSLGATIWHLLVGRSPFHIPNGDNSTSALTARILHAAAPATQRPDVPPALDRLLQQCLAKQPAHRPESALELARSLQRIEAGAGFPRTQIAVERGLAEPAPGATAAADDDATRVKIPTVSGSAPRAARDEPAGPPVERTPVRVLTWALLGVVVLAGAGTLLFLTANRGGDRDPGVVAPTTSATPQSVAPGALEGVPRVTGRRTPRGVRFAWTWPDGTQDGDSWWWTRTDTGDEQRTADHTVLIDSRDRVCLQVQLIRGQFTSAPADRCVD